MKLLRLRISGLRSFTRETEIDLGRLGEQGLFGISGPTGAGKSTILDGIFLALFGRTPRGEASECVSAGALELGVRLELEDGGRRLAVERRFKWSRKRQAASGAVGTDLRGAPKHPPLRLEEHGAAGWTPIDLGGRKAEDYLATQIVKVTMSDFQQAVVLPQGEFDALLGARPAERRTLLSSLFRTEHLGAPLIEVLRAREASVKSEMGKLDEAEREVRVTEEAVRAAETAAEALAIEAKERSAELLRWEEAARARRSARERCAARDQAEAALAIATTARAAREGDRERAARARRAAGAAGAALALAEAERALGEANEEAARAEERAHAAEATRRGAARALGDAAAVRRVELPVVMAQLGRARQAEERGRDLAELEAATAAREGAREEARAARERAEAAHARAREDASAAAGAEREAAARLARAQVGEDERAEVNAAAAIAEMAAAEERLAAVIAEEMAAAGAAVREREAALARAEQGAREAAAAALAARAEEKRLGVDAERAAAEVERAERDLLGARRAAAAADLASALRDGEACPVCGAREHPGADHGAATTAIDLAERAREAAERLARGAEKARGEAARAAALREEEARARQAEVEAAFAALEGARVAAERQRRGEEVPRAVAEARAQAARLSERAELSLGAVPVMRREAVRAEAARASYEEASARVAALNRRAREAETLARSLAEAHARSSRLRNDEATRAAALEAAARSQMSAESEAARAGEAARARREEVRALLADLEPAGQRDLFAPRAEARSAAAWVADLEARAEALTAREAHATAALDEARAESERLMLTAREASGQRGAAVAEEKRARAAAIEALRRAGIADLEALAAAAMSEGELEALEGELVRVDREVAERAAVAEARRRDVTMEVAEEEAREAEAARDEARRAAASAGERAGEARAWSEEQARRRARSLTIRAQIEALAPRARRLAALRQVVAGNQLSELAAERHLAAVTRGAAALLRELSSERYALIRAADGSFAVTDGAHGGLARPPSTLSGGETFLVSLALALSLSERIQLAGRTRFDFFFLDEGFGALDPATLEIALSALEKLRGPSRVIGMISHVGAIEERMPRRLRVLSERRGGPTLVVHEP